MAKEEEQQKAGDGEAPPPETILETEKERDPDEAVFAEQAIHEYANQVLDQFRESVQSALDGFSAWIASQADAQSFDNSGFNAQIGEAFLKQMVHACGGHHTPIGAELHDQLDGIIDAAVRDEAESGFFVTELARGARDFTWFLRDNLEGVLSNHWDHLRDLAYEGSRDFIPALHAFGLPKFDWQPTEMQGTMIAMAEKLHKDQPKTQQEALEKDPEQDKQEEQQLLADEEEKKQQVG